MNWLTRAKIAQAAEQGPQAALACSTEHWRQLAEASEEELREAFNNRRVDLTEEFCALCRYDDTQGADCAACPFDCGDVYAHACGRFDEWVLYPSPKIWLAWKAAARAMYDALRNTKVEVKSGPASETPAA